MAAVRRRGRSHRHRPAGVDGAFAADRCVPASRPFHRVPRWLLSGCGLIALYAWIEFPFANPAVMITFWLCFFTAIRYHQLTIYAGAGASTTLR